MYTNILAGQNACDSMVTLNLTVLPAPVANISQSNDTLFTSGGYASYEWLLNNNTINGANDTIFITTNSGNYAVIVYGSNGCQDTSNVITVTILSIDEIDFINAISIYPNPADEQIHIEEKNKDDELSVIQILNFIGQDVTSAVKIKRINYNNIIINISDLPSGMYLIKTQTTTNKVYKQ